MASTTTMLINSHKNNNNSVELINPLTKLQETGTKRNDTKHDLRSPPAWHPNTTANDTERETECEHETTTTTDADNQVSCVIKELIDLEMLSDYNPVTFCINMDRVSSLCQENIQCFERALALGSSNRHNSNYKSSNKNKKLLYYPAFSVKNVPFSNFLGQIKSLYPRYKFECASIGEILITVSCKNINYSDIIYDCPCKSMNDLKFAIDNNISLNIDNLEELNRVSRLWSLKNSNNACASEEEDTRTGTQNTHSTQTNNIGLRLNPSYVGKGGIKGGKYSILSVSTAASKFGVPVRRPDSGKSRKNSCDSDKSSDSSGQSSASSDDFYDILECNDCIFEAYKKHEFLNSVMCHIGSQGMTLEQLCLGIKTIVDFAVCYNKYSMEHYGLQQIKTINIGGGLHASYDAFGCQNTQTSDKIDESDETSNHSHTFGNYVSKLQEIVPELFNGDFYINTEFGRAHSLKACFMVSRIEYIKEKPSNGNNSKNFIMMQHIGANLLPREVYQPKVWKHNITLHSKKTGLIKEETVVDGSNNYYDIAGPLCFAGDIIGEKVNFGSGIRAEMGDYIVVHDSGAATIACYSRHCSVPEPCIVMYSKKNNQKSTNSNANKFIFEKVRNNVVYLQGSGKPQLIEIPN